MSQYKEFLVDIKDASIYQGQTLVLSEVKLRIKQGEFIYLVGKTGSGKSSLMKTIYGDLPLKSGKGKVVDWDLNDLNYKKVPFLRRQLGIVFQDFNLLMDRTINENLEFVLKATGWKDTDRMKMRCEEVLRQVGVLSKGFKMPHELSGGEQQRVVVARALLNSPPLILADEPTGNLDPDTSEEIMRLLFSLNMDLGTSILMATHDYNLIEKFPARIITCREGKIYDEQQFIM